MFIERHVEIETPTGVVVRFLLWPFQRKTIKHLHEDGKIVVLKARRLGLSWLVLAYALWLAIFQPGSRIIMLCKTLDDSKEMVSRVRRMLDRLSLDPASSHLIAGLKRDKDNVEQLQIGTSVFRALPASERSARQETAALWIWDEAAFVDNAEQIMRAALPIIEGGGKAAIVSTGNGVVGKGKEFSDQFQRAWQKLSSFIGLFWPWDSRPDRGPDFRRQMGEELGDIERAKVEYPETIDEAFLRPDTTLVYSLAGIVSAERLGAEFDALLAKDKLPPPVGGVLELGIDWGVQSHILITWPLPSGGFYVLREVVTSHADVERTTAEVAEALRRLPYRIGCEHFDAAGATEQTTFHTCFRRELGYSAKYDRIPFNKYKTLGIDYLQMLFRRTADAQDSRRIAISPTGCPVLTRQLRTLEFADADLGKVDKGDDHGPDALITLAAHRGAEFFSKT